MGQVALPTKPAVSAEKTVFPILFAISFSHLLNDSIQAVIPAIYPVIKESFRLNFTQIGLITLVFQLTASLCQPFVGLFTDRNPMPYSLAVGMCITLIGLLSLSVANVFPWLLLSVALIGIGSAIFHPEASRVAFLASGGKKGMAQSLFQVGGNAGSAIGPLLAALVIVRYGQSSVSWFAGIALLAICILVILGNWYKKHNVRRTAKAGLELMPGLTKKRALISLGILLVLVFSKYVYMASMSSYYTFYLIEKFHLSVQESQIYLFVFLFSVAVGTFVGGPLGDRIGRRYVIWISILGAAPFTLLLPHVNLFWTGILTVCIGLTLSSAFSAILVYAQELVPGKVGMIAGLFFGFAFGMGGIGSAVLGRLADATSLPYVYNVCSFLPLLGILTVFLPNTPKAK
ncbi:MFS transporter, FSR family, fosmidomycin resistance protein [Spirosoma endophyticum]|uniref:MFS transporter, FSR family, fosmidomycin resistance protein n=2 Tax=Spirosoma endophyticum TaxID=662367 RepID=A0A1I1HD24_9BACT|nr:MFS transporter, FSR family, fosmidomycin resistance protein [Spirosoma endophyticum]